MFMFVYAVYPLHIADRMPSGELLRPKEPLEQIMNLKVGAMVASSGASASSAFWAFGTREWIAAYAV